MNGGTDSPAPGDTAPPRLADAAAASWRLPVAAALACVAWSLCCWWYAQRNYEAALAEIVVQRNERSVQEAEVTARHIARSLAYLRGVPVMFREIHRVERALRQFGPAASAGLPDAGARREQWTREPMLEDLSRLLAGSARNLSIDLMFVVNAAGDCIAASNTDTAENLVGTNYADRDYFRQAQAGQPGRQYAVGRKTNVPGLYYSAPVMAADGFQGIVVVKIGTPSLAFWVEQADTFVADDFGVVIMAHDKHFEFHALPGAPLATKTAAEKASRYLKPDLPTLGIAPAGIARYPELVRIDGVSAPVSLVSRPMSEDALQVYSLHAIPEFDTLAAARSYQAATLAAVGTLGIALLAGAGHYLTRRRQTLALLRASESRFRSLFENSPVAYQSLDRQGTCLDANDRLCELLGYTRGELLGRRFTELFVPGANARSLDAFEHLGRSNAWQGDVVLLRKSGVPIYVQAEFGIQYDADGRFVQAHCVLHDISDRKWAEDALERMNVALARQVEEETAKSLQKERLLIEQARHAAMGEMIGNIAHQWRQPLSTLGLIVQNLRYDFKDGSLGEAQLDDYVDKALHAITQMSLTIDDFRDFFKPSRAPEAFNPVAAARDCLDLVGASLKAHDIRIRVRGPEDLSMFGYQSEFAQILVNLIANAKDALVERGIVQGHIDIDISGGDGGIVLTVADNGGGIPPDHLDKIFDPYFTTKDKGTGIGLYMTRTIVEQHMHGSIRAANTADGACFTLELPTVLASAEAPPTTARAESHREST